jgi:hypothetical protein
MARLQLLPLLAAKSRTAQPYHACITHNNPWDDLHAFKQRVLPLYCRCQAVLSPAAHDDSARSAAATLLAKPYLRLGWAIQLILIGQKTQTNFCDLRDVLWLDRLCYVDVSRHWVLDRQQRLHFSDGGHVADTGCYYSDPPIWMILAAQAAENVAGQASSSVWVSL